MPNNLTAEQALAYLIKTLETNLLELLELDHKNEFVVGEWYAYTECLEMITRWKEANKFGLDYEPEKRFNIITR